MNIEKSQSEIEKNIDNFVNINTRPSEFREILKYSLLPAGKLFRPLLTRAVAMDNNSHSRNHQLLECSIEIHHVYTLIHDDLPCMDDDNMRRGRESSHIKYNEWKALLAGDALLNLSYQLIGQMNSDHLGHVLRYFSWANGAKGLIYGQVKDLSLEMTKSLEDLIETHQLKTSRLIQTALVTSYILCKKPSFNKAKLYHRFGDSLGISFQLLDDICELADQEVSKHEQDVNPFIKDQDQTSLALNKELDNLINLFIKVGGENLKIVLKSYFEKILKILVSNKDFVLQRVSEKTYLGIITRLQSLNF